MQQVIGLYVVDGVAVLEGRCDVLRALATLGRDDCSVEEGELLLDLGACVSDGAPSLRRRCVGVELDDELARHRLRLVGGAVRGRDSAVGACSGCRCDECQREQRRNRQHRQRARERTRKITDADPFQHGHRNAGARLQMQLRLLVDMSTGAIAAEVQDSIKEIGVLEPGLRVLVMLSGGADSVCLLHALVDLIGPSALTALHVNHGLRPSAAADERFCAELCDSLGVPLEVERVQIGKRGNMEALAREARYSVAERVRRDAGLDRIATGHTASDQVETVLYRLVSSPGRRALLGMQPETAPSSGRCCG